MVIAMAALLMNGADSLTFTALVASDTNATEDTFVVVGVSVSPTTIVVNSTLDGVDAAPGNGVCATVGGVCTLRAAVQEANNLTGADVITLPAGTYTLTIAGTGEFVAATGDLNVNGGLTINGAGAATTIVDGGALDGVFRAIASLTLNDLTVQNGNTAFQGGCISGGSGLSLMRVRVQGCRTTLNGAAWNYLAS